MTVSIDDHGAGRPVVLLHGWSVTTHHWRHLTPALLEAGRRVLAVTLPGLGDRGTRTGPFDKQTLAARMRALLTEHRVGPVTVVGHDWGGTVGYLLAAEAPELVDLLVVEEEIPPGIDVEVPEPGRSHYPTWHGPFLRAPGLAVGLVPGRDDILYRTVLQQSAGPRALQAEAIEDYLTAYAHPAQLAATLGYYRTASEDTAAVQRCATRPLTPPVITVGGAYGMGYAVRDAYLLLTRTVTHIQVDTAGHYPLEQSTDAVSAVVDQLTPVPS